MSLLGELQKLIEEHGSSSILKERIALIQEQAGDVERKNEALTAERDALKAENESLRQKLQALTVPDQFIKQNGVLWLRLPNGKYEDVPYCPKCEMAMTAIPSMRARDRFKCSLCGFMVNWSNPPE